MEANPSFPEIVNSYREHLRQNAENHLSFTHFCRMHDVRPASVSQWMHRKGMSVGALYYSVILEKIAGDPTYVLPSTVGKRKNSAPGQRSPQRSGRDTEKQCEEALRGVNIVFPDGTQINIRQTTPTGLTNLIHSYNKLADSAALFQKKE
jgi:hypothetical protein